MSNSNFPDTLDTTSNLPDTISGGNFLNLPSHPTLHNVISDALIAVETKVGTGASTPISGTVLLGDGTGTSSFGQVPLTTSVTGVLPTDNGGTGSNVQNFVDLTTNQNVGGNKTLTGTLSLATGTTVLGPLVIPSGTLLTSPTTGDIEFDGTNLYFTNSSRQTVNTLAQNQTITGTKTYSSNILFSASNTYNVGSSGAYASNIYGTTWNANSTASMSGSSAGVITTVGQLKTAASTTTQSGLNLPTGTAPTAPNNGDLWYGASRLHFYTNGEDTTASLTSYTQTTTKTVANTAAETTLLTSGTGTLTIPANFLSAGKTIRINVLGTYSDTANPTMNIKVYLGATVVMTTGAITSNNATNQTFEVRGVITCYTTGVSGTVWGQGYLVQTAAASTGRFSMANTAATTIDTTASNTINVSVKWGSASASNTITTSVVTVEYLN
jgi:hypothetical protein